MNAQKIIAELKEKSPGANIVAIPEENPTEIICEVDPTSLHPDHNTAVAVIEKSAPHLHKRTTEIYKVLKGELKLFLNGKEQILKEGESQEIRPYTIHWAEGNETWVETYSTPGWTLEDHRLLGKEEDIYLVPYDSNWPQKFIEEKKLIEDVLGNWIVGGVHHVGSTSVPRLSAKPVIDIMVGVENLEKAKACIDLLAEIQYEYFPYREDVMHWFCKPSLEHRTHHLYLMEPNTKEWEARLIFPEYLRSHENARKAYEVLKTDLSNKFTHDREAYTQAKTEFVKEMLEKALKEKI